MVENHPTGILLFIIIIIINILFYTKTFAAI